MTIEQVARHFTKLRGDRPRRFDRMAEVVLSYQRASNPIYSRYCKAVDAHGGVLPAFLPVQAFKQAAVVTYPPDQAEHVFESSATGSGTPSRHYVRDLSIYERSVSVHFASRFGTGPFLIASYLPSYAQQGGTSSLLYMVDHLIDRFGAEGSGSILDDPARLRAQSDIARREGTQLLVFGAAFGMVDLLAAESFDLPEESVIIETGGMKTHRREMGRGALHELLADGFGVDAASVRSEYGMCELLSQCYTREAGLFHPPPWMRAWVVDPAAPFEELAEGKPGALAVLDLANVYSAAAILTQDRAVRRGDGFEVLGRLTGAELRGCNFLLEHV